MAGPFFRIAKLALRRTYRLYDPRIDLSQFCCGAAEKNITHRGCITSQAGPVELGLARYSTRQFLINSGQLFGRAPMKSLIGPGNCNDSRCDARSRRGECIKRAI